MASNEKHSKKPEPVADENLIGSERLSEWIDVPVSTLNQWAYRGVGPAYKRVGRHRRYAPQDVRNWLDAQTRP